MHDVTPSVVAMAMRMLTNDLETEYKEIVAIYKARWAHRVALQADKAELPAQILLRRECQRHQDTGVGNTHRQYAHYAATKGRQPPMEFLRPCHHRQNHADVLY